MTIKRFLAYGGCALLLAALAPPVPAQSEDEENKPGFFGDRFALFVEVGFGASSLEDLNLTNGTSLARVTYSTMSFDDLRYGHAAVGWKLPFERGTFELHFDGYREDGYLLQSTGNDLSVVNPLDPDGGTSESAAVPIPWWFLTVKDGDFNASLFPPSWANPGDDANGNGLAEPDEVSYADQPESVISRSAFEDLDNRFGTIDLRYRREFGGRKYGGAWSAGFRHWRYEGNLLVPTWLALENPALGFTTGGLIDPIVLHQETSGIGPTGSLGFIARFLPEHLHFYANARLAFVVQSLDVDSGVIFGLTRFGGTTRPGDGPLEYSTLGRIDQSVDKDSWQVTGELGLRVLLLKNFLTFELALHRTSFQDSVLLPSDISVPENPNQVFVYPEGIDRNFAALFQTEDLLVDAYRASLRFQF